MLKYFDSRLFVGQELIPLPTVLAGQTWPGDYSIFCAGHRVGRIVLTQKAEARLVWDWHITGPYILDKMGRSGGSSDTLKDAKAAMRALFDAWLEVALAKGGQVMWHE